MTSQMLSDIEQQPDVLERSLREGAPDIDAAADLIRRSAPELIVIAARGSSAYAGSYARSLIESTLGIPVVRAAPVVATTYKRTVDWRHAVVIAISQSGGGPDVQAVVAGASAAGIPTIAITNDTDSGLARAADLVVPCRAGPEAITATKSYVTEVALLAALVASWTGDAALRRGLGRVPGEVAAVVADGKSWLDHGPGADLADALAAAYGALVVSRGYNLATAREVALKLTETSGLFASGESAADFLHGHVVLATESVPLLAFRPDGPAGPSVDRALERALSYGARQWVVGGRETEARADALALTVDLPDVLTPIPFVVPGQLLAERVARLRGRDPDRPIGLVKVIQTL
jgi:glucosamine--fructose-6-phosphate aminotransferase (isomerizing)